jgi:hypothetical protein
VNSLFAARSVDISAFMNGLSEGEPVAWTILGAIVAFSAFGLYQKFRSF